jgi:hypothetical protein
VLFALVYLLLRRVVRSIAGSSSETSTEVDPEGHRNLGIGPVTRSFFEFRSTCSASAAHDGIQAVHGARHLFPEHCRATPNPMAPSPQRA